MNLFNRFGILKDTRDSVEFEWPVNGVVYAVEAKAKIIGDRDYPTMQDFSMSVTTNDGETELSVLDFGKTEWNAIEAYAEVALYDQWIKERESARRGCCA